MARITKYVSGDASYLVGGVVASVTVPTSGWSGSNPATISVAAAGLKAGDDVLVQVDCPENYSSAQTMLTEFAKMYRFACVSDGYLKIWASTAISSQVSLKVW